MTLAQVYGVDIGLSGMLLVVAMAVGAAVGSPGTPGVGIDILAMVLSTVGIPAEGIALIMGVDRILDMSRTTVNVVGDMVAAKLMDSWVGTGSEGISLASATSSTSAAPAAAPADAAREDPIGDAPGTQEISESPPPETAVS